MDYYVDHIFLKNIAQTKGSGDKLWEHLYAKLYKVIAFSKVKIVGLGLVILVKLNLVSKNKKRFYCPICGYYGPFLNIRRRHALCPKCGSAERHRLQFLVFEELRRKYNFSQMSMLHVAPEPFFKNYFHKLFLKYNTIDIRKKKNIDFKADLQNLPFEDNTYDCFFASHVLEHIQNDRKAISEIHRVLKTGGLAIIPVPIASKKTIEYPEPNPYESYHFRAPGLDYFGKYLECFRSLEVFSSADFPEKYQLYLYEDRSQLPNAKMPLREAMKGEKHSDFVPVCFA